MTSLLEEARKNTHEAKLNKTIQLLTSATEYVKNLIKKRSKQGDNSIIIELASIHLDKSQGVLLANQFFNDGFATSVSKKNIPDDSSVGYYQAEVLTISW